MNEAIGTPTGSASGSGTDGSKVEMASYASAPTAPPVKRGIPSTGTTLRRGTKARSAASGSGRLLRRDRQAGLVRLHADGARRGPRDAVPDLEDPARADAQEAVAAQPLAALDGLEQVGRRDAVVQAQERADGRLEVRGARGAQQDRVGGAGEALRFVEAERVGHGGGFPSAA